MPTFAYEAMNSSGQEVKDELEAASSDEAIVKIRAKGYFPTKVREKAANTYFQIYCQIRGFEGIARGQNIFLIP